MLRRTRLLGLFRKQVRPPGRTGDFELPPPGRVNAERLFTGPDHAQIFTCDALDVGIRIQPGDQCGELIGVSLELDDLCSGIDDSTIKAIRLQQTRDAAVDDESHQQQ